MLENITKKTFKKINKQKHWNSAQESSQLLCHHSPATFKSPDELWKRNVIMPMILQPAFFFFNQLHPMIALCNGRLQIDWNTGGSGGRKTKKNPDVFKPLGVSNGWFKSRPKWGRNSCQLENGLLANSIEVTVIQKIVQALLWFQPKQNNFRNKNRLCSEIKQKLIPKLYKAPVWKLREREINVTESQLKLPWCNMQISRIIYVKHTLKF